MLNSYLKNRAPRVLAFALVIVLPLTMILAGCDSQLEEKPFSQITPQQFFQNEEEFVAAATAVYAQLRTSLIFNQLDITEHSSDELMVPTRGPDWGDGGQWRDLTQHNWDATHPLVNNAWNDIQIGIARANGVLSSLAPSESLPEAQKAQFAAEVRFLRAWYYHSLMDLYGGVPIVLEEGNPLAEENGFATQPVSPNDPPAQNTRAEVFDFVLQELTGCTASSFSVGNCIDSPGSGSILANLPTKGNVPYGRATKGAAYALTARALLNAEIFTGEPTQGGITPGTALYEGASAAADWVINSGSYMLADDFFDSFRADNNTSPEIIFAATYKAETGLGFQKMMSLLHYNHPVSSTPWNGFTTIAEFYKAFDTDPGPDGEIGTADDVHNDVRGKQFLVGNQFTQPSDACAGDECFSDPSSAPVTVRGTDTQLNLKLEIPTIQLDGNAETLEAPGARPLKFEIDANSTPDMNMGNDFPIFRLAEMYLIKAEAENEISGPGAALPFINAVRERSGADPISNVGSADEMHRLILQERGYEFVWELMRRQDLIRYEFAHGGSPTGGPYTTADDPYAPTWTAPWLFKKDGSQSGQASEPFRALFPIPQNQISVNPNLQQNPGYN